MKKIKNNKDINYSEDNDIITTTPAGCMLVDISKTKFDDERGYFIQLLQTGDKIKFDKFKQINTSFSRKNVVRGMHNQIGQEKLVYVVSGKIIDYVIKFASNKKEQFLLTPNNYMLYIPGDCAHGFMALEDSHIIYLTTEKYNSKESNDINPASPCHIFPWTGQKDIIISKKDLAAEK